jgi:hypothetical protein
MHMVDLHGKFWNPSSPTATMIRAIFAHSNIKEHYSSLIMMPSGHLHDVVSLPVLP